MAKLHPGAVSRAIQALGLLGYDPEEAEEIVATAVSAYQDEVERLEASGELGHGPGHAPSRPDPKGWDDEADPDEE